MIRFLQSSQRSAKYLIGGFLLLISISLVITLIPGSLDTGSVEGAAGLVARVDGQDITLREVDEAARRMGRQQFQRGIPQQFMPFFRQQAAEQLVTRKAVLAEARRLGLQVTDDELRAELRSGELGQILFPEGKFIGQQAYETWVQQRVGMGVAQFEREQKEYLLLRKLSGVITGTAQVTPDDVNQELLRENTRVKMEYAVLSAETVAKTIQPTETELKAWFEANQKRYENAIPEKRKARYVVVDPARVGPQVEVTRQDLENFYNQRREQYRMDESVDVRHILIKTPEAGADGKADEKGVAAARAKAEDILQQLRKGAKFEDLASKVSEDPGSAESGGLYQGVTRGRMVPEFEQAAFTLEPGKISDLVQTSYGFHILRVDKHQKAGLRTLDEMKDIMEPQVRADKASRALEDLASKLEREARSSDLAAAASASGLNVVTTDFFTRTDTLPGIGHAPQFMEAVFRAKEKDKPALARLQQGYALFEVLAVQPASTPTFEQIRSRVENEFRNERAATLLAQKTAELSDRARARHNLKLAARELGAEVKTSELVSSSSQVPDLGSLSGPAAVVLRMKPGEISGPISVSSGGAVISILERQEPSPQEIEQQRDRVHEELLARKREALFQVFASELVERMEKEGKIKKNKQEFERLGQGGL
ncbi:MAG: peptidyl-prolyl cis-trans isomerase [Acidobacteria bacterium]|nr:peptidyl-prolyl cis-trans isomerase [Acidobacteriota bacterium]